MDQLVKEIVALEWSLFDKVQNQGGRASCQDDWTTFQIMRSAQLSAWTPGMRWSYLSDLNTAREQGRNPLAEKYGYMMERTAPQEFAEIKDQLPPRTVEQETLIKDICRAHVEWLESLNSRYPKLTGRGRPIRSSQDGSGVTSFETHLWGELSTYSVETLRLYRAYVEQLRQAGRNLNEVILKNTVQQYGWSSLEDAEKDGQ